MLILWLCWGKVRGSSAAPTVGAVYGGFLPNSPPSALSQLLLTLTAFSLPSTFSVVNISNCNVCLRRSMTCRRKESRSCLSQNAAITTDMKHHILTLRGRFLIVSFPTTSFLSLAFVNTSVWFCIGMHIYMRNIKAKLQSNYIHLLKHWTWVQFWGTLLHCFHVMLLYSYTSWHSRGKYCSFYTSLYLFDSYSF